MRDQLKFVDTKEGEIKDMNVIKCVRADERQRESREGEKSEKGERDRDKEKLRDQNSW